MIKRLSLLIFSVIFCLTTFCCHAADVRRYTSAQIKSYVDNTPRNVENNIAPPSELAILSLIMEDISLADTDIIVHLSLHFPNGSVC